MNSFALAFLFVSVVALLLLPRRAAPVPFIAGACYMTLGQGFELGPFTFTVIRILIAVGVVRVIVRREKLAGGLNGLDWLTVAWSLWACVSSAFHQPAGSALVYRLGMAYNVCGIYFLLRIFCWSLDDVVQLTRTTALVLTFVALAMLYERASLHNVFSVFGGVPDIPFIREGQVRAYGPFAHPILAGTVGAVSLPLMIGIWREHRLTALIGILACVAMVIASASSSPVITTGSALGALLMWRFRRHMRTFRWAAAGGLVALSLVMKAPIYYLIARIDIVGGSTGWYRSRLIESSIEHLNEWWLAGTDYTAHWMAQAMMFDPTQVDITNHYLKMGVLGGLPLLVLFVACLAKAFSYVGSGTRDGTDVPAEQRFVLWALGCGLFAHAATFLSVSYFDQSFVFLYLNLAAIGSVRSPARVLVAHGDPGQLSAPQPASVPSPTRWSPRPATKPMSWPAAPGARTKAG